MQIFHDAMNTDELAAAIERLAQEVARMRAGGPLSIQDVQQAASSLTRSQLLLNELVRIDLREQGVNQERAERFVDLENKIRVLRDEIYQEVRSRPQGTAGACR